MANPVSKIIKKVRKAPTPSMLGAAAGETLIREGPRGFKSDLGIIAAFDIGAKAIKHPLARNWASKALAGGAALGAGTYIGEPLEAGARGIQAWADAQKEKRASKEKYGTVEAATQTRHRRRRSKEISDRVNAHREQLIAQGSLPEGAVSDFTGAQISEELRKAQEAGISPQDALLPRAVGGEMTRAQQKGRAKKKERKEDADYYYSRRRNWLFPK